ncbi:ciliary microtubule associated protein 1A [Latimeria chalumnae]|uniref:ciliary microtubule associated protein 1A n=1 Tax=Latimeria chalumnae TaxID=7897 RepID=UPI0003C185C8|nr:PREDICTED: outer dense fiber protein 3-like protein 2 [Latimeria chalumnae]|eukprot:XP_005999549.1 PREDICTED: outer dense fiber protein 3-like protein 2 [Latimeria chalumnae]
MGENLSEKKRPEIDARVRGPGPGRYGLPPTVGYVSHDYTRYTSPAFSFRGKLSDIMFFKDSSPGPRYYFDPKMTRFGKDGSPAYSMLGRSKVISNRFQTPGPGSYSPENTPPLTHHRPPSYTMGSRTRYRKTDAVPAPNRYTLPSLLGSRVPTKPSTPSYSVSGRTKVGSFSEDLASSPGPSRYNSTDPSTYRQRLPAFSMLGRHDMPVVDSTWNPGPGAYSPEKVTADKIKAPSYSLGIRHSEFVTPLIIDVSD